MIDISSNSITASCSFGNYIYAIAQSSNTIYVIKNIVNDYHTVLTINNTSSSNNINKPNSITTDGTYIWFVNNKTGTSSNSYTQDNDKNNGPTSIFILNDIVGANICRILISDINTIISNNVSPITVDISTITNFTIYDSTNIDISSNSTLRNILYCQNFLWVTCINESCIYKFNSSDCSLVVKIKHPQFFFLNQMTYDSNYIWTSNKLTLLNTSYSYKNANVDISLNNAFLFFGIPINTTNSSGTNIIVVNNSSVVGFKPYVSNNTNYAVGNISYSIYSDNYNIFVPNNLLNLSTYSSSSSYNFYIYNINDISNNTNITTVQPQPTHQTITFSNPISSVKNMTSNFIESGNTLWITCYDRILEYDCTFTNNIISNITINSNHTITNFNNNSYNLNYGYYYYNPENIRYYNPLFIATTGTSKPSGSNYGALILVESQDISCFNKGTNILCFDGSNEILIPVELITTETIVKTYKHGYRKVTDFYKKRIINNPDVCCRCLYKLPKTGNMIDDLIITGWHGIMVDQLSEKETEYLKNNDLFNGAPIDDKKILLACSSDRFTQITTSDEYTVYHFTLENDGNDDQCYIVWSNGIMSETPSKNTFNMYMKNLIFEK
jgi:hypothetical protein